MSAPTRLTRALRALPFVSFLLVVVGVAWLLMLPLDAYSRRTYISENALLPGQVHTYFSGSETHIFHAYKNEVSALANATDSQRVEKLASIFRQAGLKIGKQKYEYTVAGEKVSGENIYAVLQAPRGDATEALVMVAGWENADEELNEGGVALVMTLARYLKRWSVWSKDLIFLITADSRAGLQAWVDAYQDVQNDPEKVASLPIKSGAIQGVVVVDYPVAKRFESLHIIYDGVNGQLPNLDLINTANQIATGQMGIRTTLQEMWGHTDTYQDRLRTMLRGMVNQGLGHASGAHSPFMKYHIDAITLQAYGDGWHDELALGRVLESLFRSLNNLLEHFHQSFFFYLLMATKRFVSIGTYLPSAMLIAVNFTIVALGLWVEVGIEHQRQEAVTQFLLAKKQLGPLDGKKLDQPPVSATMPKSPPRPFDTHLLPISLNLVVHTLGFLPLYLFNTLPSSYFRISFSLFSVLNFLLPFLSGLLLSKLEVTKESISFRLTKCISLLLLGMFLSALATLNFSLSFLVGLLAYPLALAKPLSNKALSGFCLIIMYLLSPTSVLWAVARYFGLGIEGVLWEGSYGWEVWGLWTQVVIWCVWWPAWIVGGGFVGVTFFS